MVGGNQVDLLIDGPATYAAMHAMIEAATSRIHLENYIIEGDECGRGFADHLIARARAGISVRVMYDWIGSFATSRAFWRRLRHGGVDVRAFGPFAWRDPLVIFARDHRKVLTVDGRHAVTGGLCIGNEWVGDASRSRQPWRDTALAIHGAAVRDLDRAFLRAWTFNHGAPFGDSAELPPVSDPAAGDVAVRVVATEPGRERGFRTIDLLLGITAERIWVTEAYLAAPQRLYQALKDAARDGVDVRLLLPGSSDLRAVRNLSRIGYRGLLRAGIRIWEWNGPMLHAKTIVADGQWTRVGSSNLNPSSLLANWEVDIFAHDRTLGSKMEEQFQADLSRASEVVLRPRRVPMVGVRDVFPALSRQAPANPGGRHDRSFRERRTRAIVILGSVLQGARAAIFGPLALVLLIVAVLFAIFPEVMAWVSAVAAAAAGVFLAIRAVGYRIRG